MTTKTSGETIGSRYVVELTTADDKIKIDFASYFGAFKQRQRENFNMFLDFIWDSTVVRLVNSMADDLDNGKVFSIGKCSVTANGILVKDFLIEWNDLSYQRNYNRLTLNSKSNASIWTNLYYTETDNVHVLMNFLEWKFRKA